MYWKNFEGPKAD